MDKKAIKVIIKSGYKDLKDFQRATVEYVFNKLYNERHRKHLVADEVGLGKTIVAKGIIIKAMERHMKSANKNKPFKVVYICSNLALTGQNLTKLNIFKNKEFVEADKGRLIFLAYKPKDNDLFQLSSLTPSTSFRLTKGTGVAEERKLIWLILSKYQIYSKGKRKNGLKLSLMGYVDNPEKWKNELDEYKKKNIENVRRDIFKKLKNKVRSSYIDLSIPQYSEIKEETKLSGVTSLQKLLIKYSLILRNDNVKRYSGQLRLIGKLRRILTEVCLDYLEADLYILDEFQKFRDLIESEGDDISDAAIIANKVFHVKGAKVLMLSATPFKPFTTSIDDEFNENHYKEFKTVLSFLYNYDKEKLSLFEKNRKEFFNILRRPDQFNNCSTESKEYLENLYKKVISRTERLLVSDDKNTLVKNIIQSPLEICTEDIQDFIRTDKIIQELDAKSKNGARNIVDYSKSVPFPLSFLDGYQIKADLKYNKSNKFIQKIIRSTRLGWFDLRKVQKYKPLGKLPNSKMRYLLNNCLNNGMWRQLWLSPCIPYYETEGSFKDSNLNSKFLIFSKWKMVPRAISSIVSYESERLTIGDRRISGTEKIVYTPPFINGKKIRQTRKPSKILALKNKNGKPQKMSAFSIVYPSLTLASISDIQDNIRKTNSKSLSNCIKEISSIIKVKIEIAGLKKYCKEKRISTNWYWVAPLLLDKFNFRNDYDYWLNNNQYTSSIFYSGRSGENSEEESKKNNLSAEKHFDELKKAFNNPEKYNLGQFPKDLCEVLALKVIGSPAICSLRLLKRYFKNKYFKDLEIEEEGTSLILNKSLDIATSFHSMFDKPESISIVRLNSLDKNKRTKLDNTVYWKDVLNYCVDGNLQSVLDEFGHLIYSDYKDIEEFTLRISDSVSTRTSSLKVDNAEGFLRNKSTSMRCHYAVDFGNQDMDKEDGRKRIKSILENFNSPFRPFVLATTSIGQEGLDFHYYCRKVMHWNLPTNPIDFEQREGRVNRYKGLVIRQNIVKKYGNVLYKSKGDLWNVLFNRALKAEGKSKGKCDLVPYWHLESDDINIERIIPLVSYSKDVEHLKKLLDALTLYRLTFGQPRQEELVNSLYKDLDNEQLEKMRKDLMINLCPITYN
ncbi:MAG: hypothetical protein IPJ45_09335 [Ignavibacteria bacterium]|nr:hypothetical protein [Ignavibacteria bacterium]